ncbi:MAG: site-2 protease family protein [Clostridiales Family XIII bacterium]|nr:site-2 protease family protein [Clostridiales Family XIII bacterium]
MRNFLKNPFALILLLIMAVHATRGGGFRNPIEWIADMILLVPGLVIGISAHEFAHAKAADMLGDPTPRMQGRVTLNPFKHFDLIGLIALLLIGFGWGKPVQISPHNFRNVRRASFIVAIAGVAMNFVLAFLFFGLCSTVMTVAYRSGLSPRLIGALDPILENIVVMNLALMIFNLLPVPPLDGFNIVTEIFDLRRRQFWYTLYNFGFPILMILILLDVPDRIMMPALNAMYYGFLPTVWGTLLTPIFF